MRLRRPGLATCISLILVAACSRSEPEVEVSAEAELIFTQAAEFYKQRTSYRVDSRVEATIQDRSGSPIPEVDPLIDERTIVAAAPDKLMVQGQEFWMASDGNYLRLSPSPQTSDAAQTDPVPPASTRYYRTDAPASLEALGEMSLASLFGGAENLVSFFLIKPGLNDVLRKKGEVVGYQGRETIGGTPAHHLVIRPPLADNNPQPAAVTELWVAAEGDPLLLQIRHTPLPKNVRLGRDQFEAVIVSQTAFEDWQFNLDEPAETFAAPRGGRRVADLSQLVQEPSALIGQPAPASELQLLDGTRTSLTELQAAQKIVLLDFWATWCGPCRDELPFVARLAEEFADQGVVLFAVNQMESPRLVEAFQQEQKYNFTAALDETGAISEAFEVSGLPCLYMLGRDGTVQVIHVGVGPDTEQSMRQEIEALIAGRNIATEGLPD
jgi:thiol-disulfide isomerase/thioredoxin